MVSKIKDTKITHVKSDFAELRLGTSNYWDFQTMAISNMSDSTIIISSGEYYGKTKLFPKESVVLSKNYAHNDVASSIDADLSGIRTSTNSFFYDNYKAKPHNWPKLEKKAQGMPYGYRTRPRLDGDESRLNFHPTKSRKKKRSRKGSK